LLDRTVARNNAIYAPTVIGEALKQRPGSVGEAIAGTPERAMRLGLGAVGTLADAVATPAMAAIGGINNLLGGAPGKAAATAANATGVLPTIGTLVGKYETWKQRLPESARANISATESGLGALGMKGGVGAVRGAPAAVASAGRGVENTGLNILGGGLKIKQSIANRGYGATTEAKKRNILKNISKYNLESVTGNYEKMSNKASKLATERVRSADDFLSKVDAPEDAYIDNIIGDAIDKVQDFAAVGKEGQAESMLESIISGAEKRGMSGKVGIDKLIEFKRKLDPDGNLFKSGPGVSDTDNLDRSIRKELYRSAVREIEKISPEAARLNREAKELIDISNVANDAASRVANRNKIWSLSNTVIGGGGLAAGLLTNPLAAAGAAGVLALKGAAEGGRGAAALIKTGKAISKASKSIKPFGSGIKNERGAVGDISATASVQSLKEGLRPAILSPETGKVYTGPMGHKYILNKTISREEPKISDLIKGELFKDNSGKYSDYIGFVNKAGEFISRKNAEELADRLSKRSVAQMYHESGSGALPILGATGAAALGGLTISSLLNKNKNGGK
jgi:hypothetical protein